MNYEYKPGISFSDIPFTCNEERIIEILGEPDRKCIEYFNRTPNNEHKDIEYTYKKHKLVVSFTYYNELFDNVDIKCEKVFIENINIFDLKKDDVFNLISKYTKITPEDAFDHEISAKGIEEGDLMDEGYYFKDICLTLWFEEDYLNDICMSKPEK